MARLFHSSARGAAQDTLLGRYSARLVTVAERHRADAAVIEAHRERALADLARIDTLKAQARDPLKAEFVANMFVAHMSHELRTPLNAIIGFSDMLRLVLKNMAPDGKVLGYVDDINSAGWHLLRVVNDILDLSKIDAGKFELSDGDVDFVEVTESCARMIAGQMAEKSLSFELDIPPGLPKLWGDDLKLKQILINLLSNAVKFTPEGGRMAMRVSVDFAHQIVVRVSDSGVGIAAEDISKVFTPFTQLNATVSRKVKGTGLGLPLSRALTELHGGTLTLESEVGVGTTAILRLPINRPGRQNSTSSAPLLQEIR